MFVVYSKDSTQRIYLQKERTVVSGSTKEEDTISGPRRAKRGYAEDEMFVVSWVLKDVQEFAGEQGHGRIFFE